MSNSTYPPYLRLVEPVRDADEQPHAPSSDGELLGFVDMSRTTDTALEMILARMRPAWMFDLRPVPYFDIGRLNRKRMFDLFESSRTSYRDIAGRLKITRRNDASLNSGAVARLLNEMLSSQTRGAPVIVLVDDDAILRHAMRTLPRSLQSSTGGWFPAVIDIDPRSMEPDLVLRSASGDVLSASLKYAGPG